MFITIPNDENVPVMVNPSCIEYIVPDADGVSSLWFRGGNVIRTRMPRSVLVQMLSKPQTVQPTTEFEG